MAPAYEEKNLSNWVTQLRKGLLELCIFGLLDRGEVYAYDLVKRLASVTSLVVTEGTIYPLLSRLKAAGMIQSRLEETPSGPARKYYSLTPQGSRALALMRLHWSDLVRGVNQMLEGEDDHV